MITKNKFLNMLGILLLFCILDVNSKVNAEQVENFCNDLKKADDYWVHNNLGWDYAKNGQYDKAAGEYKKSIDIIERLPGENWTNVSKREMGRINKESRDSKQVFPRYRLIEVLEKAGRYEEALQNVEWLMKNQVMKGKEEFLKRKLEGMKQGLLQKMRDDKTKSLNSTS